MDKPKLPQPVLAAFLLSRFHITYEIYNQHNNPCDRQKHDGQIQEQSSHNIYKPFLQSKVIPYSFTRNRTIRDLYNLVNYHMSLW